MRILRLLENRFLAIVFGVTALLIFNFHFYLIATLPGTDGFACIPGANLTPTNIIFAFSTSILVALTITTFIKLWRDQKNLFLLAPASSGAVVGTFTVFCTLCTLPVISVFGISIGLSFFTFYNTIFKILSIALLLFTLFLLEKKLGNLGCTFKK